MAAPESSGEGGRSAAQGRNPVFSLFESVTSSISSVFNSSSFTSNNQAGIGRAAHAELEGSIAKEYRPVPSAFIISPTHPALQPDPSVQWHTLPLPAVDIICMYLVIVDVMALAASCKTLNEAVWSSAYWQRSLLSRYPSMFEDSIRVWSGLDRKKRCARLSLATFMWQSGRYKVHMAIFCLTCVPGVCDLHLPLRLTCYCFYSRLPMWLNICSHPAVAV